MNGVIVVVAVAVGTFEADQAVNMTDKQSIVGS